MEKIEDFLRNLDASGLPPEPGKPKYGTQPRYYEDDPAEGMRPLDPSQIDPAQSGSEYTGYTLHVRGLGALRKAIEQAKANGYFTDTLARLFSETDTFHNAQPQTLREVADSYQRAKRIMQGTDLTPRYIETDEAHMITPEEHTRVAAYFAKYADRRLQLEQYIAYCPEQYERYCKLYGESIARIALSLAMNSTATVDDVACFLQMSRKINTEFQQAVAKFTHAMQQIGADVVQGIKDGIEVKRQPTNRRERRAAKHAKPLDPAKPEGWRKRGRK